MRIEEYDKPELDDEGHPRTASAEEEKLTIPREVFDLDEPDIPVSQEPEPDFPLANAVVEEVGPRQATGTLTRTAVIGTAAREIGYNVKSGAKYWEGVGKASWAGAPWCAAFVQWVFKVNGSWYPAPLPYYVPSFQSAAKKRGEWVSKGTPGDLVIYDWGGDGLGDHIGFLERYTAFGIQTIEGNTSSGNAGSQNNGGGVWRRVRTGGYIGFVHFKGYGQEIEVVDPKVFPLPKGHWFGPDDGTAYSHSGVRGYPDTENIKRIQTLVKTDIDGSYGPKTKAAVAAWEAANNDTSSNGLVEADTWNNMAENGLPDKPGTPPAPPKPPAPVRPRVPFPLPVGHWYGPNDGTWDSHSGVRSADRPNIKKIQKVVGASVDGIYGPETKRKVVAWQKKNIRRIADRTADGLVGRNTWNAMFNS